MGPLELRLLCRRLWLFRLSRRAVTRAARRQSMDSVVGRVLLVARLVLVGALARFRISGTRSACDLGGGSWRGFSCAFFLGFFVHITFLKGMGS